MTETVTFADGSTKEIEVAEDGTVINPEIPGADTLNAPIEAPVEEAPVEEETEINSQPEEAAE